MDANTEWEHGGMPFLKVDVFDSWPCRHESKRQSLRGGRFFFG
jgi:hypothetical protein